ncbi:MAG: 16S rRNA (guanine(966)-N(2))-methyltransferase RsmD, partial [Legionellaceae bacterium]
MNESIRIIGGLYRGKKLTFAAQPSLRPTPNRIRETLFNWLMHDIRDADCLDAFAGSGALGFEAFSRGAKQVTLIEHDQPTYACLKKQAASFNTTQLTVLRADVCDFIKVTQQTFDIIFFD